MAVHCRSLPGLKLALAVFLFLVPIADLQAGPELVTAEPARQRARLTGYTRARSVLDIATENSGKVETVDAEIGQPIGNNNRFACLDRTFIDLDIESNRAEIARSHTEIEYYSKQVERHRELVRQASSSEQKLDEYQRDLGTRQQQLRILQLRDRTLNERRERFCIYAPAGWIVMERYIEPGEWVRIGDSVARVGNFMQLLVPFALSMTEYKALQAAGENLALELPDLNTRTAARLERVSPGFDEKSRKILVDLQIEGSQILARGGIRADLVLDLPVASGTVIVPETAVEQRYEQYWLERPDGERIPVVYLGPASSIEPGQPKVRVSHSSISSGQKFVVHNQ